MHTRSRSRSLAVVLAGVAAMFAALVPAASAGAATTVPLASGTTSVTSSPAVTSVLLRNGILPLPTGRGQETLVLQPGGLGVKASFPVTGGAVDPATLAGTVEHQGGLNFISFARFKTVSIADFTIVIDGSPHLVATKVNGKYLAALEHWPSNPLSRGSYTCYLPGQFTTIAGNEGKPVGNLHFAGEHANSFYIWQGFQEGALLSGIDAATEVLGA